MLKLLAALTLVSVAILTVASVAHADEPTTTTTAAPTCIDEYYGPGAAMEEIPCSAWTNCGGLLGGSKVPTKYYPDRCPKPATTTTSTAPPVTAPRQGSCPEGQYDPHPSAPPPHVCLPLAPVMGSATPLTASAPAERESATPDVAAATTTATTSPRPAPTRKPAQVRRTSVTTATTIEAPLPIGLVVLWPHFGRMSVAR